ncbi:hypothetical protein [Leuconostoc mesenteroides]|uniref:hypothetical protein n=1 Tax=Leuconostoc mesenteroides TaxID=1245 RepID=UPI00235F3B94|nr:hypothetical protein [Leuconostoc mesenteroides]
MNNEELELSFLGDLMLSNDIQGLLADVVSQMKADTSTIRKLSKPLAPLTR